MSMITDLPQPALDRLKSIVGPKGWKSRDSLTRYFEDPRGRFTGCGQIAFLPADTQQTADIVRVCNETGIGIVPFGGGTGVVAGQFEITPGATIILSLERMNTVRAVLPDEAVLIAEAGCILEHVHEVALAQGMVFPLGMASKGSCTIGGNLATNAGGIQVVRYGNARDLCLGIEAVLPNGDVFDTLSPLRKNNTGYDLRHLLIGSEGTLGIITAATLQLVPQDPETVTAFCALDSPAAALKVFRHMRSQVGSAVSGLELMSDFGLDLVTQHFPTLKRPFAQRSPWYLLLEASGQHALRDQVEAALMSAFEQGLMSDVVIAESEAQRQNLWDLRENTPESNRLTGAFCNSDTAVPIADVDAFMTRTHAALQSVLPGLRVNSYGHIGDGNIHHNVFAPEGLGKADFLAAHPGMIDTVREVINDATLEFGGSISAEHGIGRLKKDDLARHASKAKLEALRRIKAALDPNGIMNPGAMIQ